MKVACKQAVHTGVGNIVIGRSACESHHHRTALVSVVGEVVEDRRLALSGVSVYGDEHAMAGVGAIEHGAERRANALLGRIQTLRRYRAAIGHPAPRNCWRHRAPRVRTPRSLSSVSAVARARIGCLPGL